MSYVGMVEGSERTQDMRVIVIGAGIGGLTLAQALDRGGLEVAVHDRDPHAAATGGYRLQLDQRACTVLGRHLAPAHYQALVASSASPRAFRQFTIADHRMRSLAVEPRDPASETLMIGRIPLRQLLCRGLEDRVRFGAEYTHHEIEADGTVTAHFADGTTDHGDVLVGADGVGSRVARQLAGYATSSPVGVGGIAARTPLDRDTRGLIPPVLDTGPVLAFGPDGGGMFLTMHDPAAGAAVDPSTCQQVPAETEEPALIWGLLARDQLLDPTAMRRRDGPDLVAAAVAMLRIWSPDVQELIERTAPHTAAYFRFHAADPDTDLTPWPAGRVTALGDAVHAMPPTGGQAAATAIRDADHLADELLQAHHGASTIPLAIYRFHTTMAGYAPGAVRESLAPLRWQRRFSGPLASCIARIGLPVLATAHHLRRTR